ncbi:growth arrest and DNA damage-inducible proteins-interacting protein 1-like [Gigantopelta aegis]|uniref:growth arrest and DNA damage-inducible proteins-interacting protein 1-like n=1 Tax=Gigantopelta aegis TaxID=1735272 RepID=UPI001B88A355|nr:growth arrest and DNA damage-inducible proteins-interacting protein 1-like [Gigantopelta aegis]
MAASMYMKCCWRLYCNYDAFLMYKYPNKYHALCISLFSTSRSVSEKQTAYRDDENDELSVVRDVSGLKGNLRRRIHNEMPEIINSYQESLRYQRRRYAKFGSQSDVDPRIMWPSKSELAQIIEDEKMWEPTLEMTLKAVHEKRLEQEKKQRLREEKVEQNMQKMSKWIEEYHHRKEEVVEQQKKREAKKAKLLEEAQAFFGYKVDPRDKKFKELMEKKELEEKKLAKKKRKQSKLERLTSKFEAMSQET